MPELAGPGPGSYGAAISPRDDKEVMGRKLSPGYSFSKIGLAKNGSGTREMNFNVKEDLTAKKSPTMVSKTRKNSVLPGPFETGHSFQREVSLMSLRQKHPSPRMINVDSNTSLTVRPMPSENFKQVPFPGSPASTNFNADIGFRAIIKD